MFARMLLALVLAGAAHGAETHRVKVEFLSMNGHTRSIEYGLTSTEAARLEAVPTAVAPVVLRARHDYAQQLGYTDAKYGPDYWKIVPGLRVQRVRVRRDNGSWTDVHLR